MGTTGLVSQAFGRNDSEAMKLLFKRGILTALGVSLVLICFQNQFIDIGLYFFEVNEVAESLIHDYFVIRIWAAPATISLFVIIGWLLGAQNSRLTLLLAIVINLFNAIISYLLVWHFDLGIKGVAYGTLMAQYVGLITGIIILLTRYEFSSTDFLSFNATISKGWKEFFTVNRDIFIRTQYCLF